MNKLIGLAAALFGIASFIYPYVNAQLVVDGRYTARTWIAIIGGLAILGYEYRHLVNLKKITEKIKNNKENKKEDPVLIKEKDKMNGPSENEQRDFECLIHLRNRLVETGNDEGFELIKSLNSVMFDLHKKEKINESVTPPA